MPPVWFAMSSLLYRQTLFQIRCVGPPGPKILNLTAHHTLWASCNNTSCVLHASVFRLSVFVLQQLHCVCSGWTIRLSLCETTQASSETGMCSGARTPVLQCSCCMCSTLKVHSQWAQGVFFGTLVLLCKTCKQSLLFPKKLIGTALVTCARSRA